MDSRPWDRFSLAAWLPWIGLGAFLVVVLRSAWLTEDAFITFRTVDNFVHGYGLRWNVIERVQAYSHPLWMFLVSLFYFCTREIFYTVLFLSVAVSLVAVVLLVVRIASSPFHALFALVLLTGSKAFVDYSTSGMENPLTHLLLALFCGIYFQWNPERDERRTLFWLSFLAALGGVNRMDALLLFGPPLLYAAGRSKPFLRSARTVALGFVPFVAWEIFSLVYYGFFVPNTAYSKLNTGIPLSELATQGVRYLLNSLRFDPLTLTTIAAGLLLPLFARRRALFPLSAGMLLYLAYIVRIGGDFMSGRFLTPPFFLAVVLLARYLRPMRPRDWGGICLAVLLLSVLPPRSPLRSGSDYGKHLDPLIDAWHISDERGIYYPHSGLLPSLFRPAGSEYPDHWWAVRGRGLRQGKTILHPESGGYEGFLITPAKHDSLIITTWLNVGFSGFYAGPRVHIIDAVALAEPLLVRLPALARPEWGPGHFGRLMPEGYLETHITGRNAIADSNLAVLYDVLCEIARGDLFTPRRWREIWRMHTGQYDDLVDFEFYRNPPPLERARSEVRIYPGDSRKRFALAEAYWEAGRKDEAIQEVEIALQLNDSFNNLWCAASLYQCHRLPDRARTIYRKILSRAPKRLQGLKSQEDKEKLGKVYNAIAQASLAVGRKDSAFSYLRKAARLLSDNAGIRKAEAHVQLGKISFVQGKYAEAVEQFRQALALKEDSAAWFYLGLALLADGQIQQAKAVYGRAVERYGQKEAERVGAVDGLKLLIARKVHLPEAYGILKEYWPAEAGD